MTNKKSLKEITKLFKSQDSLAVSFATGQAMALLMELGEKPDWEHLHILCGMITAPYPLLNNPKVSVTSGYFGPIERYLNKAGANVDYLPASFRGIQDTMLKNPTRVVATVVSPPDKDGFVTFGTHASAVYRPFVKACRDPQLVAIAEINQRMPVVYGLKGYGDNKIHVDEIDYVYEVDSPQIAVDQFEVSEAEEKIAQHVVDLIESESTLQFGIGAIPNIVASLLAKGDKGDFGIHTELFSDGQLQLIEAGKISNQKKKTFQGHSIFTFALGSQKLYDWLDERKGQNQRSALCLPVDVVNEPYFIQQNNQFVAVNAGLMIDFAGQVCSEAIVSRQYSGLGGQLSFVEGASLSQGGKNILCIKSTATVGGKKVSNIVPNLPEGSLVSTPRHFVHYVVTEHGVVNLQGVSDKKRAEKLITIADPEFRDELKAKLKKI